jgi:hypothetical protein
MCGQKEDRRKNHMKFLIVAKPGNLQIPVDQGAVLLEAGLGWLKAKLADGSLDCLYNFFGGGGFGIGNADSNEELLGNLLAYPLYPFFTWEVTPLLDLEASLEKYMDFYKKQTGM